MDEDYRKTLSANLVKLLELKGATGKTLTATYIDGPKATKPVGARSLRYWVEEHKEETPPSGCSLDMLAAWAKALDTELYLLLYPGLEPGERPRLVTEREIEREVDARVNAKWERLKRGVEDEGRLTGPAVREYTGMIDDLGKVARMPEVINAQSVANLAGDDRNSKGATSGKGDAQSTQKLVRGGTSKTPKKRRTKAP